MTSAPIVFPDAVALSLTHLASELGVDVGPVVPNPRPTPFLLARRVGGPRLNVVTDDAAVAFECWHETTAQAHDLAQHARALMLVLPGAAIEGVPIYRVTEIGGVADFPDPLSSSPRFVFTLGVAVRGAALTGS